MTYQNNCTLPEELLEQIAQEGLERLPDLIQTVINRAMQTEANWVASVYAVAGGQATFDSLTQQLNVIVGEELALTAVDGRVQLLQPALVQTNYPLPEAP